MCDIPNCMSKSDMKIREEKLNIIDNEIRKVLPYVKHISANGLGELFACKHILGILSEWNPKEDVKDVSVSLETNGSLFDEKHWKVIENLGKYYLSVHITILSFEDEIYRKLSGTNQSVNKLVENLHFVKSLREKNVINYLELATVYQKGNFRQLPDFVERCINEFGADYVRLRPYDPWGEGLKEWFMDVRNVYHPFHQEFLEIMRNPIFKHPKVHDWGGGLESGLGPEPYKGMRAKYKMLDYIFDSEEIVEKLNAFSISQKIVIYGMTIVGKASINRVKGKYVIPYCLDRKMDGMFYDSIPIYGTANFEKRDKNVTIIIALNKSESVIKKCLRMQDIIQYFA